MIMMWRQRASALGVPNRLTDTQGNHHDARDSRGGKPGPATWTGRGQPCRR